MKKLIVMMLALVVAFSFTACNNDTPPPGNEGSIDVPSPTEEVPEGIYAEVYKLEKIVLEAYENGQTTAREESTVDWCYNADDVLIASLEDVDGDTVITVAKNGEHFEAWIKVVRRWVDEFYYYDGSDYYRPENKLNPEAGSELGQLLDSAKWAETSYSLSYSCTSTIEGKNVDFDNKVDMYRETRPVPEAPDGITEEEVYTLRHAVALSGYDGLSSYVLYGQMTDSDPMTVVGIEVDGTAYSLAKTDDYLGNALEDSFLDEFTT